MFDPYPPQVCEKWIKTNKQTNRQADKQPSKIQLSHNKMHSDPSSFSPASWSAKKQLVKTNNQWYKQTRKPKCHKTKRSWSKERKKKILNWDDNEDDCWGVEVSEFTLFSNRAPSSLAPNTIYSSLWPQMILLHHALSFHYHTAT